MKWHANAYVQNSAKERAGQFCRGRTHWSENKYKYKSQYKIKKIEEEANEEAEKRSKRIVGIAIQRFAGEYVAEQTISSVELAGDEIKGRLIGREGRNIRAFEQICGVDLIIDDRGSVKDKASEDLSKIRTQLFKKRQELRRIFEKVVQRLAKSGYTADIDESFSNGRRVVAVFSEYKRQVKGFLHGESDSRKTAFIEPEETIELNNELYGLEQDELKEVQKILREEFKD